MEHHSVSVYVFLATASGAVDDALFEEAFNTTPALSVRTISVIVDEGTLFDPTNIFCYPRDEDKRQRFSFTLAFIG